jgi:multicomponent Na+:H+ antiporter subunit D
MLLAMGIAAFFCVALGIYPTPLYRLLPFPVDYEPYTPTHVITQLQLLLFSGLAFAVLKRTGVYPAELRAINLDSDWLYRRLPRLAWSWTIAPVFSWVEGCVQTVRMRVMGFALMAPEIRGPSTLSLLVVFLLFCFLLVTSWRYFYPHIEAFAF